MLVLGIGIGGGYLAGYRHGGSDVINAAADLRVVLNGSTPAAMTWRDLIQWNGGAIGDELKNCQAIEQAQNGRRGCLVPLWISPPANEIPR